MFAISSTLLISTITFGGISLIGIFATLIFSILVEAIMYLGCIRLIMGRLVPIGWIISLLSKLVAYLAGIFSRGEFIYLSTNYIYITVAIILYTILFYLFIILPIKNKRTAVIVLVSMFVIINITTAISGIVKDFDEEIVYMSDSKCDEVLIRSENQVCPHP